MESALTKIDGQTRKLEELVRTLPPKQFLEFFAKTHEEVEISTSSTLNVKPLDREQVEHATRFVLKGIAMIAQRFDGQPSDRVYSANVMWYRESGSTSVAEKANIQARLHFHEDAVSVDQLAGVLDLSLNLSTTTETDGLPDSKLAPLALPVPHEMKVDSKLKVLPGAPYAFSSSEPQFCPDCTLLVGWCRERCAFSETVLSRFDGYLKKATFMQGFTAIPIWKPSGASDLFAVLNVHCSHVGMLYGHPDSFWQFVHVVRPLQLLLVKLLLAHKDLEFASDDAAC